MKRVPSFTIERCEECPYYIGSCQKSRGSKHSYCNYDNDFTILGSWEFIKDGNCMDFPITCPLEDV